jgi:hypothetical protein
VTTPKIKQLPANYDYRVIKIRDRVLHPYAVRGIFKCHVGTADMNPATQLARIAGWRHYPVDTD